MFRTIVKSDLFGYLVMVRIIHGSLPYPLFVQQDSDPKVEYILEIDFELPNKLICIIFANF